MKHKLKSLLIPLSIVSMSMLPIVSFTNGTIDTYDTSPAASREDQVQTRQGYNAYSQNISLTINGVKYNNVYASVYITDTVYLYDDINSNSPIIKTYGEFSTVINFYVTLNMDNAVNSLTGQEYVYTAGDEDYFKVNLYPSSYNNYSSTNSESYQSDVMVADFYKDPSVSTHTQFTSFQLSVPKVEMGWQIEILNDTGTNIDFLRNDETVSVLNEDFLISDYYPTIFNFDYRGYSGRQYQWGDYDYMIYPYISSKEVTFDSTNSEIELSFYSHYDWTSGYNSTSLLSPSDNSITGYLTIPSLTTDSNYVIYLKNTTTDSVIQGYEVVNTEVSQKYNDYNSYVVYYDTTITIKATNPTSTNEYVSSMYKYNTTNLDSVEIYYRKNAAETDIWTLTSSTSTAELEDELDFSSATFDIRLAMNPRYEKYDEENDRYVQGNYVSGSSTQGYMYSNSTILYSKESVYSSINNTQSVDPSGDVGNTVIGWIFISLAISSIAGISAYYIYRSKRKILENKDEFDKLNEELKRGDQ